MSLSWVLRSNWNSQTVDVGHWTACSGLKLSNSRSWPLDSLKLSETLQQSTAATGQPVVVWNSVTVDVGRWTAWSCLKLCNSRRWPLDSLQWPERVPERNCQRWYWGAWTLPASQSWGHHSAFFLPGFSYLEATFCFSPSCFLHRFFQVFLENLSLSTELFFKSLPWDARERARARVCMYIWISTF